VNYPGAQAGTSGFSVVGQSDAVQLQVIGINAQGNGLVSIRTIINFPVSPTILPVLTVGNTGQVSMTLVNTNSNFLYLLRLNRQTAGGTPAAGTYGLGIQFYGQNTSAYTPPSPAPFVELADIMVVQQNVTPGSESGYLSIQTLQGAAGMHEILRCSEQGNIVLGNQAVLATSATAGFIHVPSMSGLSGAPANAPNPTYPGRVAMFYDTTNNKLWAYNTAWKSVTLT